MRLLNYQARQLIQRFDIPVASFGVASTVSEAKKILEILRDGVTVKAETYEDQKHFFTTSSKEALKSVRQLLHDGIKKISLTQTVAVKHKYSIHLAVNSRGLLHITFFKDQLATTIDITETLDDFHMVKIAKFLNWNKAEAQVGATIIKSLIKFYIHYDASFLKIALALDVNNRFCLLDATIFVDQKAFYRQEILARSFDPSYMSQHAVSAWHFDLDYVEYNGTIGVIVNGKDSAMSTLDLLHICGKKTASIIDLGTDITKDILGCAIKILSSHSTVKILFINIFAGFMNCKILGEALLDIIDKFKVDIPVLVRLEGRLKKESFKMLSSSKKVIPLANLKDVVKKFVAMK